MSFDIIQPVTPSGTTPWFTDVYDNARVQFFDSRYSTTTPIFLGFISNISAVVLENGLGTRASVSVEDADAWLDKTILRRTTGDPKTVMDSISYGISTASVTTTDQQMINFILKTIHDGRSDATSLQLLDTSVISGSTRAIFTGTAKDVGFQTFTVCTLRSALDQIAEVAGGEAEYQYRYWIDTDGRLNYGPKETALTYATAPAEIVTDPASVRTGSASTSTRLLARDISVNLDHNTIVKGIFTQVPSALASYDSNAPTATRMTVNPTNQPYFRTYNGAYWTSATPRGTGTSRDGAGQTTRNGPRPDEIFTGPKILQDVTGDIVFNRGKNISNLTRATFVTRGKPVRSVTFTIAGGNLSQTSSPDWSYGYSQGYAQTAVSTWTLVKAWIPGSYVKVNAPMIGLSNVVLFMPTVTMRFAQGGGTFQIEYDIELDYRRLMLSGLKGITAGG
jgi:hypothetical protein